MPPSKHEGSAALSQAVILAGFAAHLAVGLALTVLLGRSLAPADFGFFALLAAIFAFARDATDLGTTATAARDMRREPRRERPLLEGLIAWRRAVGAALGLGVLGLAAAQSDPGRRWVLVAAAAGLAALGPGAFNAVFQARQAQVWPGVIVFASQLLLLAGCLVLIAAGTGGPLAAGLVVAREVLAVVGVGLYGCWLVGYRPVAGLRGRDLRRFAGAAGLWALAALCRHLYGQMDVLAVYAFRGEAELGALAAAYRPISPAFLIPWLAVGPLVPVLVHALSRDPGRYRELVRHALRIAVGAGALVAACGIVLAPDLVTVLYGGRYLEAPLDATAALRWLALAVVPVNVMAVAAVALLAAGREKLVLQIIAAGLAAKVVANAAVVPAWGFQGAVITTALMEVAVAFAVGVAALGLPRPAVPAAASWSALAPAAVVAAAGLLIPGESMARVAIVLAAGGAAFAVLMLSPAGRAYFAALREAGAEDRRGAGENAAGPEGENRIAFGGANGYKVPSGGNPRREVEPPAEGHS